VLIRKLISNGVEVHYLVATDGELGFDDETSLSERRKIRQREQLSAASILGVADTTFPSYPDGQLNEHRAVVEDIVYAIRRMRADLIISYDPFPRIYRFHPDYRAIGQFVVEAAFPASRSSQYFRRQLSRDVRPQRVQYGLLFESDEPDFFIETTRGGFGSQDPGSRDPPVSGASRGLTRKHSRLLR
jgi:LmbE family N-acetylglucosaminyl deacetylase